MLIRNDWPATGLGKILSLIDWFWDRHWKRQYRNTMTNLSWRLQEDSKGCATTSDSRERTWAEVWGELVWSWFMGNCSEGCSSREPGAGPAKGSKARMGMRGLSIPSSTAVFFFFCPRNANVTQDSVLGWKLTKVKALWVSNNRKSLQLAWAERFIGRMQLPHRTQRAVTESHT